MEEEILVFDNDAPTPQGEGMPQEEHGIRADFFMELARRRSSCSESFKLWFAQASIFSAKQAINVRFSCLLFEK